MLTVIGVKNAKPKERPYKIADGKGLYLFVLPNGRKSWRYRYRFNGKESIFIIGEFPETGLEDARAGRAAASALIKSGKNPTAERRQQKHALQEAKETERALIASSFEVIAYEWHEHQQGRWSATHASACMRSLQNNVFPLIGSVPIDQVTPPMVLQVIREIESRNALETAAKTLQRMTAVFRYAVQTGRATYNPATDMRGVLKSRKVKHHPMIMPDELPAFLQALTRTDLYITTKLAIQFTILTAARSGEVRGATWDEIDLEKRLWSIPAERMKMKVPHSVPLSTQSIAILNRLKILFGDEGLVFPGINSRNSPLSENTMLYALYRLGYHSRATMHGFRALFSTIANESGFNPDAIERQLAHREKNEIRAAYHRSEYMPERIKMMQWWADHLHKMEHVVEDQNSAARQGL